MTDYFVDEVNGADINTGLDTDNAWATAAYGMSNTTGAGDTVWIRRNVSDLRAAGVTVNRDGTTSSKLRFIGWPRGTHAIASSDWTNGSTTVTIDDGGMAKDSEIGRWIVGPDGGYYLITNVTAADTIIIDRKYAGATVSNDATAVIQADEDYAEAQAIDDSAWTIKLSTWTADSDVMASIDFNNANLQMDINTGYFVEIKNLKIHNSVNLELINVSTNGECPKFIGCYFVQNNNRNVFQVSYGSLFLKRCIMTGSGNVANTGNSLINSTTHGMIYIKDSALYDAGAYPLVGLVNTQYILDNVNLGIEGRNEAGDLYVKLNSFSAPYIWKDVRIEGGGTNGEWNDAGAYHFGIYIENYQKQLGYQKTIRREGDIVTVSADGAGDRPSQRTGGSSTVLEITFDNNASLEAYSDLTERPIFDIRLIAPAASSTYRFYINSEGALTANDLYIVGEYVISYDAVDEWAVKRVVSTNTVSARANAADWSQYIEVTVAPAVESPIRLLGYCNYYHATNNIYIDPVVSIDGSNYADVVTQGGGSLVGGQMVNGLKGASGGGGAGWF